MLLGSKFFLKKCVNLDHTKGTGETRLIRLAVAGFNLARTITKASATGLGASQDDLNKAICFPGSLVNNPLG